MTNLARPYTVLVRGAEVVVTHEQLMGAAPLIRAGWTTDGTHCGWHPACAHAAALEADPVERWWVDQWPARAGRADA